MEFSRERYVRKLRERLGNGLVKVITGSRRAGKSYLLNNLFYRDLLDSDVDESSILRFAFDSDEDLDLIRDYFPDEETKLRQKDNGYLVNSRKFRAYLKDWAKGREKIYLLLDEVQLLEDFPSTVNGLLRHRGYEVFVTGSNSKFLSTDIATEFRGRGSPVHVLPLSFSEYVEGTGLSPEDAWRDYVETGGIPLVACMSTRDERRRYLELLCEETYLKDVVARNHVRKTEALSDVLNICASLIGSFVNPSRIADTFGTVLRKNITDDTVSKYIDHFEESFLLSKALRYNVKGRKYIGTPYKLYFEDPGVRNARLNFRQIEETHIMENILYNELRYRGFNVDVGQVPVYSDSKRTASDGDETSGFLEVDFVATSGDSKYYIQSALSIATPEKADSEKRPLRLIDDSFTKLIVTKNRLNPFRDEKGIVTVDLFDFLLDFDSLRHI